ncbi:MAG: hypothetical protein WCX73_00900 [Candidatus Pacearchaeota archaeon]|jgi:hypothetical protein
MTPTATPYLKECIKELDKILKWNSRELKLKCLTHYEHGLKVSLHKNYPDKFDMPEGETPITEEPTRQAYVRAKEIAFLGPLEIDNAIEYILAEVGKRKKKFSKPGILETILFGMR